MAFVTKFTFSKLCANIKHEKRIDKELFIKTVWNDERIAIILNKYEREYLFNYIKILDDEEGFYNSWFKEVAEHKDTKKYVFEKNHKRKFHLISDCKFMQKDFVGYIIPEDLRSLNEENNNDDVIYEYRYWFRKNNFINKINLNDQEELRMRYNSKYPKKYKGMVAPLGEGYKLIDHFENSHLEQVDESINKDQLLKDLNSLIFEFKLNSPCQTTRRLVKWHGLIKEPDSIIEEKVSELFSTEFVKGYGLKKIKDKLNKSRQINRVIIKKLIKYFQWTYRLEHKNFKIVTLENFGLQCCNHCKNNSSEN